MLVKKRKIEQVRLRDKAVTLRAFEGIEAGVAARVLDIFDFGIVLETPESEIVGVLEKDLHNLAFEI